MFPVALAVSVRHTTEKLNHKKAEGMQPDWLKTSRTEIITMYVLRSLASCMTVNETFVCDIKVLRLRGYLSNN